MQRILPTPSELFQEETRGTRCIRIDLYIVDRMRKEFPTEDRVVVGASPERSSIDLIGAAFRLRKLGWFRRSFLRAGPWTQVASAASTCAPRSRVTAGSWRCEGGGR